MPESTVGLGFGGMNDGERAMGDQKKRGFTPFAEQDEAGADLTLIRANLKMTLAEWLDAADLAHTRSGESIDMGLWTLRNPCR